GEVEPDLLDLPALDGGFRPALKPFLPLDAVLAQVLLGENEGVLDEGDKVGRLALRRVVAGEAEHAADDGCGALAPLEDLFQGLGPGGVIALGFQAESGVINNRGQDIVKLVGDAGGQRADAAEPLGAQELLAQLFRLGIGGHHVLTDHGVASRAVGGLGSGSLFAGSATLDEYVHSFGDSLCSCKWYRLC